MDKVLFLTFTGNFEQTKFIVNSECTSHMSNEKSLIRNIKEEKAEIMIDIKENRGNLVEGNG